MITVEKIGGTSMTQFGDVLENIILEGRKRPVRYGRIFVVSAYGGVTDMLLEHKKTSQPGIYQKFADGEEYEKDLDALLGRLKEMNAGYKALGLDLAAADDFITKRIDQTKKYLYHLAEVMASGYVDRGSLLFASRELLASIGESHSAFNAANICMGQGINTVLVDLSGFHDTHSYSLEERIRACFADIDLTNNIVIATGYTKSREGIMREFDRGYSEVTFSKVAVELKVDEAIIHKEFHLSSADPKIVGPENAVPVGQTNYDVADQLADVGMEAIHPKASKPLEMAGISLRIKNTFEPEHPGTLIARDYRGIASKVDIITGSQKMIMIDIHDSMMVGEVGIDLRIGEVLQKHNVSYIMKSTNANSITLGVRDNARVTNIVNDLKQQFQVVDTLPAAIVCVIGSNIAQPGILAKAAGTLSANKINIICVSQSMRQVNVQFVIERERFEDAIRCLNSALCVGN